jgi:nucleoside-diphosphate-sugar epimerase
MTLLITGASGLIGSEIARRYLKNGADVVLLAHRSPIELAGPQPWIVRGDITRPRLGLSLQSYRALTSTVTSILHCAARTDFSIGREEAERVNVDGTKHIVSLARDARHLEKLGVLSTVYDAGRRSGVIRERELSHSARFVNPYEQSKYRMERFLRKQDDLPVAVYRLSTVIGGEDGQVRQFNAVHRALRLLYNGLVPMVPGTPQSRVDLISTDYATSALFELFDKRFAAGRTYHIAAGKRASIPLQELLEETAEAFSRFDRHWSRENVEIPPIVTLETFRILERSVGHTSSAFLKRILRSLKDFAPQLSYPKVFDTVETERSLRGTGIFAPQVSDYYARVIRYCLASGWRTT